MLMLSALFLALGEIAAAAMWVVHTVTFADDSFIGLES